MGRGVELDRCSSKCFGRARARETKGTAPRDFYSRYAGSSPAGQRGQFVARRAMRSWARRIQLWSVMRSSLGAAMPVKLAWSRPIWISS